MQSSLPTPPSPSSLIQYAEHCLLFIWMDAHWTRQPEQLKAFTSTYEDFRRACKHEQHNRHAYFSQFEDSPPHPDKQHLFGTRGFVPMGQPDVMGTVLLDDLDMAQTIMAAMNRTIEESTIGFCLDPSPFIAHHPTLQGHLVPAAELLFPTPPQNATSKDAQRPLLMLMRLKMEGMLSLTDPVAAQSAVLDVACKRIAEQWDFLQNELGTGSWFHPDDLKPDSWRLTLLDLQEEEEIGLLFSCQNFSIPVTLTLGVQSLTIGQLADDSSTFRDLLALADVRELQESCLRAIDRTGIHAGRSGAAPDVHHCHAFRWSRTSAAVDIHIFASMCRTGRSSSHIHGWLSSVAMANLPAGHDAEATRLALPHVQSHDSLADKHPGSTAADYQSHLIGSIDLMVGPALRQTPLVTPDSASSWLDPAAFRPAAKTLTTICLMWQQTAQHARPQWPTRHINGWSTMLIVPVPIQATKDVRPLNDGHYPFLLAALSGVQKFLFDSKGRINVLEELRRHSQSAGLPVTLRRAFMVLFDKYQTLACHPMRYDAVVDLYAGMNTLWHVLCHHLPAYQREQSSTKPAAPRLPEESVDFLSAFASASESALDLRLRRSFPESPQQEWNLDFRGPMCQVVVAGEAVLRSALSMVRYCLFPHDDEKQTRKRLGVINTLTVTASITTEMAALGIEQEGRLAIVKTDVAHLTHLTQLADYFHEAFHLIHQDMLLSKEPARWMKKTKNSPPNTNRFRGTLASFGGTDRFDLGMEVSGEIFVSIMMLVFVADGDANLLWQQQAVTFATSPRSSIDPIDPNSTEYKERLLDVHKHFAKAFVPLGVVSALLEAMPAPGQNFSATFLDHIPANFPSLEQARQCFLDRCNQIRSLFPEGYPIAKYPEYFTIETFQQVEDLNTLTGDEPLLRGMWREQVINVFDQVWQMMVGPPIQFTWTSAQHILRSFAKPIHVSEGGPARASDSQIAAYWRKLQLEADNLIAPWLCPDPNQVPPAAQRPLTVREILRTVPSPNDPGIEQFRDHRLATLFILRSLHHIWKTYLPRINDTQEWRLPDRQVRPHPPFVWRPPEEYADFLIDPTRPDAFCVRPRARRQRLRHQAVFLKTFWGIASIIRRRSLLAMFDI